MTTLAEQVLRRLPEATAERDREYRVEAETVFQDLWPAIYSLWKDGKKSPWIDGRMVVQRGETENDFYLFLNTDHLAFRSWPHNHTFSLHLVTGMGQVKDRAQFGTTGKGDKSPDIQIWAREFDPDLIGELFFHEFIHYLDWERAEKWGRSVRASENPASYFNSPKEFNTYYQTCVRTWEQQWKIAVSLVLLGREPKWRFFQNMGLEDYSAFEKAFCLYSGYPKAKLQGKWVRKFEKRLATLYRWAREQWDEIRKSVSGGAT